MEAQASKVTNAGTLEALVNQYKEYKALADQADEQLKELTERIRAIVPEDSTTWADTIKVVRATIHTARVDTKRLAVEMPSVAKMYTADSVSDRLTIK
jgi:predicted phage-related endonuclease